MTTATLTETQKFVLRWMDDQRVGALMFEGEWRHKESFRKDESLAERFRAERLKK